MRGIGFALSAGVFIALQGVANARIGDGIGTWQAAAITQFTGFAAAALLLWIVGERDWLGIKKVKPYYWAGGAFAAFIIFGNVTAIQRIGMTYSVSLILIAQLLFTFLVDAMGWFGVPKRKARLSQTVGIGMMAAGVAILKM